MTKGMARVVASRYQLLRLLGRGGMGAVWHAHDTLLGRDVAIKEIWHPTAGSAPVDPADPFIARALREARAAARLRHPGIVTVHDVVTDEGRPWIVMELINGRSLAQAIQDHGLLSERQTAEIGLHVLDALRAAHREGVAHRDVKPANILLDTDRVVLTDFGIAAIEDATALTATGQMVGSPAYLAPERINGLPATAAADLWAVGVTLYAAVTGRSPFQRDDTQATFAAILTSRPTPPAHAGRLWPVIKDLLIKDPARRLTTEQALRLLANVAYPADSPGASTSATGRRRPGWWPAGPRKRKSTPDGMPGTLVAPAPTLAAPTAYQEPPGKRGPGAVAPAPRQAIAEPVIAEPATAEPATAKPATAEPTTAEPATAEPTTAKPTTTEPTTTEPTTTEPTTAKPTTAKPTTAKPATTEPATTEPATTEPATTEPATTEPATTEPATTEPATAEMNPLGSAAEEPAATVAGVGAARPPDGAVARAAAAQPDDTGSAANAQTTVAPGRAVPADPVAAGTAAGKTAVENVAAETAAESAGVGTAADTVPVSAVAESDGVEIAADTLPANTVPAKTIPADTVAENTGVEAATDTLAANTGVETTTDTLAANTIPASTAAANTIPASTAAAETAGLVPVPRVPFDVLRLSGAHAAGTAPPAPHRGAVRRPRTARARTTWFAALAVGSLLLAGGVLRTTWPGADDDRTTGRGAAAAPSGGSLAPAAGASVKPVASRPAAAPANPSLDSCLVGTWRMTSLQVINHYEGVDARFTSSGGVLMRIWPNGKEIDDYSKSLPLKATIKGARYAELLRGVETLHVETRKGRVYSSEFSGGRTFKVTRNGKKVQGGEMISPSEDLEYICTETRMTIYGNKKSSTQSFQRLSHQP